MLYESSEIIKVELLNELLTSKSKYESSSTEHGHAKSGSVPKLNMYWSQFMHDTYLIHVEHGFGVFTCGRCEMPVCNSWSIRNISILHAVTQNARGQG